MRRRGGFTLIEVMIVVAVVALLAAIAYPSYQRYAQRAKRSEAQQLMSEITSKETQYILDARTYTGTLGAGGLNINRQGWTCTVDCTNPAYTIHVEPDNAATPPSFTITGTPAGPQTADGVLSLDSTGAKTRMISGSDHGW